MRMNSFFVINCRMAYYKLFHLAGARAKAVADDHFRRLAFGAKKTASALLL